MSTFRRGSAFPATLAFQLRELERETEGDLRLDSIVTVIDAENFTGYEDTSPTAKMQASYTDVILIVRHIVHLSPRSLLSVDGHTQNKWEHISERALDILIDHLNTLNDLTPKICCKGRAGVDPSLIFGLDSKLFLEDTERPHANHHDEVETVTVFKGIRASHTHAHTHDPHDNGETCNCSTAESIADSEHSEISAADPIDEQTLEDALGRLSKETVWRVKGFVRTANDDVRILNWAFGRFDLLPHNGDGLKEGSSLLLTMMGERGEVKRAARKFSENLGAIVA